MTFSTVTVGRLTLTESLKNARDVMNASTLRRTLTITGQESSPPSTIAQLARIQDDVIGLASKIVPVIFGSKTDRNGYYVVHDVGADLLRWGTEVVTCDWQLVLETVGTDTEVDLESRLTGATARNNSFSATGERWHAPPVGAYGYWTSSTVPTIVTRTSADGAMPVYRGLATTLIPRYGCPLAAWSAGRARFIDASGERVANNFTTAATGWELSNALVRVRPLTSSGVLEISAWTGGAWQTKNWDITADAATFGPPRSCTVLYNEPECVAIRLLWDLAPGRATVDITLRRGARFAEIYVQRSFSATLKIVRATTEAGTTGTGYVRATANDAAGNRYIVGSALTATADATNGGISKASTTTLDAFVGVVAAGSSAVAGDQPGDLYAQYLGTPSELVMGVRR